jgi:hypothetical protein
VRPRCGTSRCRSSPALNFEAGEGMPG